MNPSSVLPIGQGRSLQSSTFSESPEHSERARLIHMRENCLCPFPHVTEHGEEDVHSPQFEFSAGPKISV